MGINLRICMYDECVPGNKPFSCYDCVHKGECTKYILQQIENGVFDLNDAWEQTVKFNDLFMGNWREWKNPVFFSNALAGEGGETADIYATYLLMKYFSKNGKFANMTKKLAGGGTNRKKIPTKEDLIEELVDSDIYKILFLEVMDVSINDYVNIFQKKLRELVKRVEPT